MCVYKYIKLYIYLYIYIKRYRNKNLNKQRYIKTNIQINKDLLHIKH